MQTIKLTHAAVILSCAALLPLVLGPSCAGPIDPGDDWSVEDLTQAEKDALAVVAKAALAIREAGDVVHAAVGEDFIESLLNHDDPDSCPVVTVSGALPDTVLGMSIDFGDGCAPPGGHHTCSGSAAGTIDLAAGSLAIDFEDIACDDESLDGEASLTYEFAESGAVFEGAWDLTAASNGGTLTTTGTGACRYDASGGTTSLPSFTGTLSEGDAEWSIVMTDVVISCQENEPCLPSTGTITVSGPTMRELTIVFDAESPATGEVEVSIDGSPFFTVDLYEL